MADPGLAQGGPVEVGPAPGEEPPRKRLRHEDHEVRAHSGTAVPLALSSQYLTGACTMSKSAALPGA